MSMNFTSVAPERTVTPRGISATLAFQIIITLEPELM